MLKLFSQESKTITGAALIIGSTTVVSRVLGLVRDRLLIGRFGVGDQLDAYYASFQIPNVIVALLVLGTLSVAFIPVLTGYLAKDRKDEAWRVAVSVLNITMAVMGAICLLLILGAPLVVRFVAPGFSGEKLELTLKLTRIMMLTPFFFAVSAVLSSVLNSAKQFVAVSIAPILYNLSLIFGVIFLAGPFGIAGVAYGAVIGAVLYNLIQLPSLAGLGVRWRPVVDVKHPGVREIWRLFLPRVFGVDISQISQFIGSLVGTTLGSGSVALFNIAINVQAVPIGVVAIPFAIAAFPALSAAMARDDRREFVGTFAATFRQVLFFLLPMTAMALVLRVHIILGLFGSRGLTWSDARLAGAALAFFALSMVLQGLTPLLSRSFYALKNTVIPVVVSGVSVLANIGATYLFMYWLGHATALISAVKGLFGLGDVGDVTVLALPAAFSASSAVQVLILIFSLRRKFGPLGGRGLLKSFVKMSAGAVCSALAAWGVTLAFGNGLPQAPFIRIFVEAVLAVLAGTAAYAATLKLTKSEELEAFVGSLKRRLLKIREPLAISEAERM